MANVQRNVMIEPRQQAYQPVDSEPLKLPTFQVGNPRLVDAEVYPDFPLGKAVNDGHDLSDQLALERQGRAASPRGRL